MPDCGIFAMFKAYERLYQLLEDKVGCPYASRIDGYRSCNIDNERCAGFKMMLGVAHCRKRKINTRMDEKAGKSYWAEFYDYWQILDLTQIIDALENFVSWDTLLQKMKMRAERVGVRA